MGVLPSVLHQRRLPIRRFPLPRFSSEACIHGVHDNALCVMWTDVALDDIYGRCQVPPRVECGHMR